MKEGNGSLWKGSVDFPLERDEILFRYIIISQITESQKTLIKYWETNIRPRKASKSVCYEKTGVIHEFGVYEGVKSIETGWLTNESIVQLKLFNNPIDIWHGDYKKLELQLKVIKIENNEDYADSVEVSVMNMEEFGFKRQNERGRKIVEGDNIVFQSRSIYGETDVYRLEFYSVEGNNISLQATSYLAVGSSLESTGDIQVPIISNDNNSRPIGHIKVEYLVVHPMENGVFNFEQSFAKYWNHKRGSLEIGHRGCGTSFSKTKKILSKLRENTVGSLETAGHNGGDFVEFDVLLSKDLVPVIYHDFFLCLAVNKKDQPESKQLVDIPVKDLTLEELQSLEVYHVTEKSEDGSLNASSFLNDDKDDFKPFPTLQKLLQSVHPLIGFNVEIKWGQKSSDGVEELPHQIDMNSYIDAILKVIFEYSGKRRVVISCFDADVNTMIRWKQNKYPVLYLTQGKTRRYQPYLDPRTKSISDAVIFALSAQIMGIDVQTEEILNDNTQVEKCLEADLLMFCWGEDNNDVQTINLLKNLGLHGIIYDRINEFNPGKKNVFMREAEQQCN
ncbi:hypothetical protein CHUAL_009748 [Chamberlinius hualienensis]